MKEKKFRLSSMPWLLASDLSTCGSQGSLERSKRNQCSPMLRSCRYRRLGLVNFILSALQTLCLLTDVSSSGNLSNKHVRLEVAQSGRSRKKGALRMLNVVLVLLEKSKPCQGGT